jgi:hypothetical protein
MIEAMNSKYYMEHTMKSYILLSGIIFLLVLIATATGIFYRTAGSPTEYTTVRGEHAIFQGTGLYRSDPAAFALEGVVWDVINLWQVYPCSRARGSIREGKINPIEASPFPIANETEYISLLARLISEAIALTDGKTCSQNGEAVITLAGNNGSGNRRKQRKHKER